MRVTEGLTAVGRARTTCVMKALMLHGTGEAPRYEDVDDPVPGPGEALVAIEAAALNHRDIWVTKGLYPGLSFPAIPGSDGSGTVVAVGDEADGGWRDEAVVIDPGLDWGPDERTQGPGYNILGVPRNGTLAEKVVVPVENLRKRPAHLTAAQAAALPLAGLTAWRALMTRAGLRPEDKVLINGIGGGVALCALQFAVAHGCRVWVTSSKKDKIGRAQQLGAEAGFLYVDQGWGKQARRVLDGGADVIVDAAGGSGFGELVDALAPGGRIAVYGATRGAWPELMPAKLFFKQASVVCSTMGSPREFSAMCAFVAEQKLVPEVDRTFSLARGAEAFDHLASGAQMGKVVVRPS
ncbi:MAG: zinc-binding dehydrogenase [Myxococcota bacterium]